MPTTSSLMRSVTREVNPFDNGSLFNGVLILTRETLYVPESNFTEEIESGIDGRFDVYSLDDLLPYLSSTVLSSTDVDLAAFENSETYRAVKSIFDYRDNNAGITLGNSNVCTIVCVPVTGGMAAIPEEYGIGKIEFYFGTGTVGQEDDYISGMSTYTTVGANWSIQVVSERSNDTVTFTSNGSTMHLSAMDDDLGMIGAYYSNSGVLVTALGGTTTDNGGTGGYYINTTSTHVNAGYIYAVTTNFKGAFNVIVTPTKSDIDTPVSPYAQHLPYLAYTETRPYTAATPEVLPSLDGSSFANLLLDLSEQSDRKWEFILPAWTMEYVEGLVDGNGDPLKSEVEYFIEACEGINKGVGIVEFALSAFTNTTNARKDALKRLTAKYTSNRRSISILTDNTKDYTIAGYFTGWLANQAYGDKYSANIPLGITSSVMAFNLLHASDMIINIRDYIGRTQYASEKKALDDLFDGKNMNFWGSILNSGRAVTGGKLWYGRCNNGGDIRNTIAADMLVNNIEIRYAQEGASGQQLGSSFSDSEQSKNAVRRIVIEEISKVSEYLFIETPMVLVDVIGEKYQISINGIQLGIVTGGNINLTLVKR